MLRCVNLLLACTMEARLANLEYFSYLSTISDEALQTEIAEWQDDALTNTMLVATNFARLKTLRSIFEEWKNIGF